MAMTGRLWLAGLLAGINRQLRKQAEEREKGEEADGK